MVSGTLSQLVFPGENNPNFPWEESSCDNPVIFFIKKIVDSYCTGIRLVKSEQKPLSGSMCGHASACNLRSCTVVVVVVVFRSGLLSNESTTDYVYCSRSNPWFVSFIRSVFFFFFFIILRTGTPKSYKYCAVFGPDNVSS